MNTHEVTHILQNIGWIVFIDEVGDEYTHFQLSDLKIQIIYSVKQYSSQQEFRANLSLTTDTFSTACLKIRRRGGQYSPLIRAFKGLSIEAPYILEGHVRQMSDEAINWAQEQDLNNAMQDHAALPTDAPGARPVWHLASLAILGEVERLKSYQTSFESGDRLGFVNYVTKEYIDRAVALAEGRTDF